MYIIINIINLFQKSDQFLFVSIRFASIILYSGYKFNHIIITVIVPIGNKVH